MNTNMNIVTETQLTKSIDELLYRLGLYITSDEERTDETHELILELQDNINILLYYLYQIFPDTNYVPF